MDLNKDIWVIFRIIDYKGQLKGGICGTGFFIKPNLFVTTYHVLNEESFANGEHRYLINSLGEKIMIDNKDVEGYFPDKDMTFIKRNGNYNFIEIEDTSQINEEVYNLGYPESKMTELVKIFSTTPLNIELAKPRKQSGKIMKIEKRTINANDVKLKNKGCVFLNYSSEKGYSGGPLLSKNNKVIGIMSHSENKGIYRGNALAISNREFFK